MDVPRFEYIIGIKKREDIIKAVSFHSPYDDINRAKEDVNIMIHGQDLRGNDLKEYKIINLENSEDGFYRAKVIVRFIPNGDGTFDQIFELKELKQGERNSISF